MKEEYKKQNKFITEFMRRRRDFIEKTMRVELNPNYLLTGEDLRIVEEFKKDHNIQEGFGFDIFLNYVINYYKTKKYEDDN